MKATEETAIEVEPHGRWKVALVVFPLLLFISVASAIWLYWSSGRQDEIDPRLAMQAGPRDGRELEEHFEKLAVYIRDRGWESETGRKGLRQTIAYIDGTLSPQNYGFKVQRESAFSLDGELWPVLWIDLGNDEADDWLVAEIAYDGDPADVAFLLSAIDRIRGSELGRGLRVVFAPWQAPPDARRLPREAVRDVGEAGRILLEDLAGENLSFHLGGQEVAEKDLPGEGETLVVAGEGAVLDERIRVNRARWLAGFLRSSADGR